MKLEFYKKTAFWENIKKTLAIFSGPTVFALNEFQVDNKLMIAGGIIAFIVAIISIWFVDHDNNGFVDLFEKKTEGKK